MRETVSETRREKSSMRLCVCVCVRVFVCVCVHVREEVRKQERERDNRSPLSSSPSLYLRLPARCSHRRHGSAVLPLSLPLPLSLSLSSFCSGKEVARDDSGQTEPCLATARALRHASRPLPCACWLQQWHWHCQTRRLLTFNQYPRLLKHALGELRSL